MKFDFHSFMRFIGEFSATAVYVCLGCMGVATNDRSANGHLISSLHFGLAMMVAMHCFGFISGAHANPCVSIACCILGYITREMAALYAIAQGLGAAVGYVGLMMMLPTELIDAIKPGVCQVEPNSNLFPEQVFAIELFLTAILVYGWCAVWDVRNGRYLDSVTIRMGLLVTACSFAGAQLTGAGMNPARTLMPALYKGDPTSVILQVAAQMTAAVITPYAWRYLYTPKYRGISEQNINSGADRAAL